MFVLFALHPRRLADFLSQHCAQTLLEFNGGSSCVQVYVNQHDFFINNGREGRTGEDTRLYAHLLVSSRLALTEV